MATSPSLYCILNANKLTGPNYVGWLRNLHIVLMQEKLSYILDIHDPGPVNEDALEEEKATYKMWQNDSMIVKYIMLASMSNKLQRQYEDMDASSILLNLKELYREQSRTTRYKLSKQLFWIQMTKRTPVQNHMLKMIDLITRLGQLGFIMDAELNQDLILQSLQNLYPSL
uniref:Uncharacterized protein LOC105037105 n=1 Tax=Elaeis guineensis var. tenera TaxID=51953 RepID=A0A6I9QKY2_ELAGV